MKIAVTASSQELFSPVDPRFGRCPYFLFIDTETMQFESIENPNVTSSSGAGIQSAQLVVEKNAKAVITGSCGPNAFQTLHAAEIEVFMGVRGSIQEAIEQYKDGQLCPAFQPNAPPRSGMGGISSQGPGFAGRGGMGKGMGRGMGRGCGMGRGVGRGMGYGFPLQTQGMPPQSPNMPPLSEEEELQLLKGQAKSLRQQIEKITKRIEELEKKK